MVTARLWARCGLRFPSLRWPTGLNGASTVGGCEKQEQRRLPEPAYSPGGELLAFRYEKTSAAAMLGPLLIVTQEAGDRPLTPLLDPVHPQI